MNKYGFTLIELLIVVLIISILTAIAVPNFLEFQTRAKVARAKSDLRTFTTAIEAYAVEDGKYPPNDGCYNVLPNQLSTPIQYLSNIVLRDPFADSEYSTVYGELEQHYSYTKIVNAQEYSRLLTESICPNNPCAPPCPPVEGVDNSFFNSGALNRYGEWRLVSRGPDRIYSKNGSPLGPFNPNFTLLGSDIPYDPTNGTVSFGNILRTQKSSSGIFFEP